MKKFLLNLLLVLSVFCGFLSCSSDDDDDSNSIEGIWKLTSVYDAETGETETTNDSEYQEWYKFSSDVVYYATYDNETADADSAGNGWECEAYKYLISNDYIETNGIKVKYEISGNTLKIYTEGESYFSFEKYNTLPSGAEKAMDSVSL